VAKQSKKKHNKSNASVKELLELIPDVFIEELTDSLELDKWVKNLKGGIFSN